MRAVEVQQQNGPMTLVERPIPEPGPGEVRIRVHACGVCHSDAMLVEGTAPGLTYPRIPGHEVVGVIDTIGQGVEGWSPGERVGVGWNSGFCAYCDNCRHGNAFACQNVHDVTGIYRDGGYADYMVARTSAVARFALDLDLISSAPLLCAGITTFNALRNSGAGPGELVAVHGVGGLGHLAIQFARKLGFRTVAINRGKDKEALARELGAHEYIDSTAGDPAAALREMGGARVIVATVTNAEAMAQLVSGLAINGTFLVVGAVGAFPIDSMDLLMKRAAVKGWASGTSVDSEDTLRFAAMEGVTSMNEVYPLEEAQAAYDRMMSGKARFRVVLTTGASE